MLTEQNSSNEELLELNTSTSGTTTTEGDPSKWQPIPSEVFGSVSADGSVRGDIAHESRERDVFSMLINIYGSRDTFINEYRNMLADRLLALRDYETASEV
jgi:anaphase-promoting complex subunit 2